jgi:hypothetical protein
LTDERAEQRRHHSRQASFAALLDVALEQDEGRPGEAAAAHDNGDARQQGQDIPLRLLAPGRQEMVVMFDHKFVSDLIAFYIYLVALAGFGMFLAGMGTLWMIEAIFFSGG